MHITELSESVHQTKVIESSPERRKKEIQGNAIIDYPRENATVLRVIDGDTIETDLGIIRLLGINAPEKYKHYSEDATEFLMQIKNQTIEVLRDRIDEDKYDRKLRYIYFEGKNLNIDIVEKGGN